MAQESRSSLAGWLWISISHKVAARLSARATVISKLDWGRICFWDHLCGYWQSSVSCWLLAGDFSFLPHEPLACFSQSKWSKRGPEGKETPKMEAIVFYNLISEVRFCHMLSVTQTNSVPESTQDVNTRRKGLLGAILKVGCQSLQIICLKQHNTDP